MTFCPLLSKRALGWHEKALSRGEARRWLVVTQCSRNYKHKKGLFSTSTLQYWNDRTIIESRTCKFSDIPDPCSARFLNTRFYTPCRSFKNCKVRVSNKVTLLLKSLQNSILSLLSSHGAVLAYARFSQWLHQSHRITYTLLLIAWFNQQFLLQWLADSNLERVFVL